MTIAQLAEALQERNLVTSFSGGKTTYTYKGLLKKVSLLETRGLIEGVWKQLVAKRKPQHLFSLSPQGHIYLDRIHRVFSADFPSRNDHDLDPSNRGEDPSPKADSLEHVVVLPAEISMTTLNDLPFAELVAEAIFGDLSEVPPVYDGKCQNAQQMIVGRLLRLFKNEGIDVIDDGVGNG